MKSIFYLLPLSVLMAATPYLSERRDRFSAEEKKAGMDLLSNEIYGDFDLKLEWKISPGGNSGILFYVQDDKVKYKEAYWTGPEMQILDNNGHLDLQDHGFEALVPQYQDQEILTPAPRNRIFSTYQMKLMRSYTTRIKYLSGAGCAIIVIALLGAAHPVLPGSSAAAGWRPFSTPKLLIFSKTNGYRHASIVPGIAAIKKLGADNGFDVDATEDSTWFNDATLKKYAALVFLSPTGKVFGPNEEKALQEYMRNGGGFVGIHSATDCEYDWQWYGDLVGAYFKSHPKPQLATFNVIDKDHLSTAKLPDPWSHFDELYNFKWVNPSLHILLKIDEKSYTGGTMGDNHPMAWYHAYEGGRAFYTELGHSGECYSDPVYLGHLLGGINYAMGEKNKFPVLGWEFGVPLISVESFYHIKVNPKPKTPN